MEDDGPVGATSLILQEAISSRLNASSKPGREYASHCSAGSVASANHLLSTSGSTLTKLRDHDRNEHLFVCFRGLPANLCEKVHPQDSSILANQSLRL